MTDATQTSDFPICEITDLGEILNGLGPNGKCYFFYKKGSGDYDRRLLKVSGSASEEVKKLCQGKRFIQVDVRYKPKHQTYWLDTIVDAIATPSDPKKDVVLSFVDQGLTPDNYQALFDYMQKKGVNTNVLVVAFENCLINSEAVETGIQLIERQGFEMYRIV